MKRRDFLKATGVGLAASTAVAAPAIAQGSPEVRWRYATSWPKSLDTLYGGCEYFCKKVAEITDHKFQIQPFAAGEIVPGLQVLDAVSNGTVEIGNTALYYYWGKNPAFTFATALPFGLNTRQQISWLLWGGGQDLVNDLLKEHNVYGIPTGSTGAQMGGWLWREIKSVDDLKGMKMRIGGFAGTILAKLGVVPLQLAGGDIYPALEKGTIDAAEWVGPYDDEKLGFAKVAKYYYYPGYWEGGSMLHTLVNEKKWNELPKAYQAALAAACGETTTWMLAKYDAQNPAALRRLIASGTNLRPFSRAILDAAEKAAYEVYDELAAKSPHWKRIYPEWRSSATSSSCGSASPRTPTTTTPSRRRPERRSRSAKEPGQKTPLRRGFCFCLLPAELLLEIVGGRGGIAGLAVGRRRRLLLLRRDDDLDLVGVDVRPLVEEGGHELRECDHDADHDELQHHPGDRAPVDVRALHFLGRDAAQVEEGEAERRMHERGLHVHAQQHAEPDQVDAELRRHRREQRDDDERDLEEVEEEREEEHEHVDEHQEPDLAPGQVQQQLLDPQVAVDAAEHEREDRRADEDEDHHRGDAHGRLRRLRDQAAKLADRDRLPQHQREPRVEEDEQRHACGVEDGRCACDQHLGKIVAAEFLDARRKAERENRHERDPGRDLPAPRELLAVQDREHDRADHAHRSPFGRRREAEEDGAEHEEDQHQRRNDAPQAALHERPAAHGARRRGNSRHPLRLEDAHAQRVRAEQQHLHQARAPGAGVHVADRAAELIGEDDQHQRRRDQLGDRSRRRDHAGRVLHVVAVAHHHRQRDETHRDHRRRHRSGDRAEDRPDDDHRVAEASAHRAEQLAEAVEQVLGEAAALEDRAHQREEGDREQSVVGEDAEHALGQRLHQAEVEEPRVDRDEAERQAHRGERERHRVADQHEDDQPREHQRGHPVVGNH